jgi:threonine dehydrogenase-like Zn-dependent dehydrogenase
VDAVGSDVDGVAPGDRVAMLAENALADAVETPAGEVTVLPPAFDGVPFPGEALGCGFNIAARSGFAPGQTVCVIGAGFLGALVVAIATRAGAQVIAVGRRRASLAAAEAMGAAHVMTSTDPSRVLETVRRLTGGAGCDVVVEAVGTQEPLDLASQLVRVRGRLVIAGFHQDGPRTVDLQLWNWHGIDVVNAHERDPAIRLGGIRAAVEAVADGWLDPLPLYTHAFPLTEAKAAFDALADRPEGFIKALVLR